MAYADVAESSSTQLPSTPQPRASSAPPARRRPRAAAAGPARSSAACPATRLRRRFAPSRRGPASAAPGTAPPGSPPPGTPRQGQASELGRSGHSELRVSTLTAQGTTRIVHTRAQVSTSETLQINKVAQNRQPCSQSRCKHAASQA